MLAPMEETQVNVFLWIVQVALALAFLGAGYDQAFLYDDAGRRMAWVAALPKRLAVLLGLLEIVGAIALVVPALTGFQTWLTPAAALGLTVVMVLAVAYHNRRHELPQIAFSATFGLIAAFVAVGRFVISPF
jgi:uncharacterized membrane protein YphA (DoxX/SURF4 family)